VNPQQVSGDEWEYTFDAAGPGDPLVDLEATREELLALGERGATIRFRVVLAPSREFVFDAGQVPGFGWRAYRTVDGDGPDTEVREHEGTLANEHLEVQVEAADGTLTMRTKVGVELLGRD